MTEGSLDAKAGLGPMGSWRWRLQAGLLIMLLALSALLNHAFAHESRPAYLEIKEITPTSYGLLWRTPVSSGNTLAVVLRFPEGTRDTAEPITQRLKDSLLERRTIETPAEGLAGQRIDFVGLQATITDVLVRVVWVDGRTSSTIVRPSQAWVLIPEEQSTWSVAIEYMKLGTWHILFGIDHLLFVLALLIIVMQASRGKMKESGTSMPWLLIFKTVTAFTVAHSITLALATLGVVQIPQRPVEAVIALSIVFVAAEILHGRKGVVGITARAPWIVAFIFGLLHGFGFAGALSEVGLPQGQIPVALLFFNLGVEAGQLFFVSLAIAMLALLRRLPFRLPEWAGAAVPYVIGCLAMYWVFDRTIVL